MKDIISKYFLLLSHAVRFGFYLSCFTLWLPGNWTGSIISTQVYIKYSHVTPYLHVCRMWEETGASIVNPWIHSESVPNLKLIYIIMSSQSPLPCHFAFIALRGGHMNHKVILHHNARGRWVCIAIVFILLYGDRAKDAAVVDFS